MNADNLSNQRDSSTPVIATPPWALLVVLRIASIGASYVLWGVTRWLFTAKPTDSILDAVLLSITILLCTYFLFIGTFAPERVVIYTWKILGKGFLYILMFT